MSFYDVVMLVVLGGSIWFGFWKGLSWQVASLAAVIVSYIVAVNFREPVSHFIQADEPWNRIGAMLVLFLGTSIVIWIIYARIKSSIKRMELKGFDRQAGAALGAVKGALLCMVVTMFSVSLLGPRAQDAIHTSKFGPYVVSGISKVSGIVPAELAQYVQPHVERFHQQIGHDGTRPIDSYPNAARLPGIPSTPSVTNQYQIGGGIQQNPNQLPAAQTGYQGTWQWQAQPQQQQPPQQTWQYRQPQPQPNAQPNNNWVQPAPPNTQSGGGSFYGNNGYTNQTQPPSNQSQSPFNGASQELFSGARQVIGQAVGEAAKRAFEGQPR